MGSLAINTTRLDRPTMLEAGAHRSERSPYEQSYRSPAPSSSQRNTPQSRNLPSTPTSTRSSTSTASNITSVTPSRVLPQRDSAPHSSTKDSSTQPPEPPSPRISASQPGPSYESQDAAAGSVSDATSSAQPSPQTSPSSQSSEAGDHPVRIKVKDLQHIHSFLSDDTHSLGLAQSPSQPSENSPGARAPQYEISGMPITDVIEMVAGLLTKITTTNDRQHDHLHRNIPSPDGAAGLSQQTSSVLAFHGKNVPSISILSYLSRIHKYCPTTYEVFISLLVYFDRMTEKVNSGPMQSLRQARQLSIDRELSHGQGSSPTDVQQVTGRHEYADTPPSSLPGSTRPSGAEIPSVQEPLSPPLSDSDPYNLSHFFVVDSFNIHRLVIAAVTCASKYFSDVFYTNSRYAKVGGLPLVELNHLEMQFLLLNDFRLAVPVEELEAYATMLVEFYAREIVAQQHGAVDGMEGLEASG